MTRVLIIAAHFVMLHPIRTELIQELVNQGYDVYLSIPFSEKNQFFVEMGCKIVNSPIDRRGMNPLKDIKLIRHYKEIIKQVNPDCVLTYSIKPNAYTGLVLNFLKRPDDSKYKQICNITGTGSMFLKKNAMSEFCKLLYKVSVKNSYLMFFQNRYDKAFFLENHLIAKRWELIPGSGVNLSIHTFSPMPNDDIVSFIFVARLIKFKGVNEFLIAAERIKREYSNTRFYVAGMYENDYYKEFVENYHNQGKIVYLGFVDDIYNWIEKCHCTVLPSYGGEGVPNVLMESAAKGRVCIGSDIPGTNDVIEDGVNGFLCKPQDVDDLVDKMTKFIELPYQKKAQMGKAGRAKVEKEFDRQIVVNKYMEEIEKEVKNVHGSL